MRNLISNRSKTAGFAIFCAVAAASPAAHAFDLTMEGGGFAGGHFFSDTIHLGRHQGDSSANSLDHSGAFGLRFGFVLHPRFELETELALVPTQTENGQAQVLAFGYRLQGLVHILTGRVRPFILVGGGGFTASSSNSQLLREDTRGELHAGLGLKVDIQCNWGLRLDGRIQFDHAIGKNYFTEGSEVLLGVYGLFGKGVTAKCAPPPAPVAAPQPVSHVEPAPAPLPPPDGDADGLADKDDLCPTASGPRENGGCPDTDGDSDGVVDRLDKCAGQAGPTENAGCPWPDSDSDGLADRDDKCPNGAETKNGYQDEDGCPDEVPAAVKKFTGVIQGIEFQAGKAVLAKSSSGTLDQVVKTLMDNPSVRLEIGGHTDDSGARDKNLALSQARAESVKSYLLKKGIAADRLVAKGYGPDKPLPGLKKSQRAKNRRVEFTLIGA